MLLQVEFWSTTVGDSVNYGFMTITTTEANTTDTGKEYKFKVEKTAGSVSHIHNIKCIWETFYHIFLSCCCYYFVLGLINSSKCLIRGPSEGQDM